MDFNTNKTSKTSPVVLTLSDSDDEIFVGPVTDKEKQKAAKLKRRTQVFFPPVSWKLRSSNHSINEPTKSPAVHQYSSPMRNTDNDVKRAELLFGEEVPSTAGHDDVNHIANASQASFFSDVESPTNGYTADISSAEKTNYTVPENNLLQGYSADSLNSLSRDSLDIDQDSLDGQRSTKPQDLNPVCDSYDTSVVEDLYDAREYLNAHQDGDEVSVPTVQKQLTLEEIEELQKQLDRFAIEMGRDSNYAEDFSEKHNNSFETEELLLEPESPVNQPNIETILSENKEIPSPYDLNKQRLSDLLPFDYDFSFDRKSNPAKDSLCTLRELSEPSSTDVESRLTLSEEFPDCPVDSPRKGSTDYLPNSTQLFEELEKQIEEEELLHSNHQTTYTVLTESHGSSSCVENIPDSTYIVLSNASANSDPATSDCPLDVKSNDADALNASRENLGTSHNESCPEGIFNDTLEEMEMLLKYGVNYIYGKHGEPVDKEATFEEPVQQEIQDYRPKSADSCGSNQSEKSGRSTPGTKAKLVKAPTPVKGMPLTPSKTQPTMFRTPVKTPTGSKPANTPASNPSRSLPRAVTPRSGSASVPARPNKLNEPLKKCVQSTGNETPKFKVPVKIPACASRVPRAHNVAPVFSPRPSKFLNQIQSPIGAYIHNTPSPCLMKNVKPKPCSSTTPRDYDRKHGPVWENVDCRNPKSEGAENVNPNVGHGLPAVHYIQAPCVKLDDQKNPKSRLPRLGDRLVKLLDSPCPQVIKHEGRVRVNPLSPQFTAAVKAVRSNLNDSTRSEPATGDISVCVSKAAKRTNTLSVDH